MTINPDALEPLRTARLSLRCVHPEDAADISRLMTPAVSQWVISWPAPFSPKMAADRIDDARSAAASGDMLPLVVKRLGDDILLGWLSVTRIAEGRGLLSYWLGENHHGRGYMREAVSVALPAAFRLLKLDVIAAAAQLRNERSLALMHSLGMKTLGEQMIFAPARSRDELCVVLELRQPSRPLRPEVGSRSALRSP